MNNIALNCVDINIKASEWLKNNALRNNSSATKCYVIYYYLIRKITPNYFEPIIVKNWNQFTKDIGFLPCNRTKVIQAINLMEKEDLIKIEQSDVIKIYINHYFNQDRFGKLYRMPYHWLRDQKSGLYLNIYMYILVNQNQDDELQINNWATFCRLLEKTVGMQTKVKKAVLEMEKAGLVITRTYNKILYIKVNQDFYYESDFDPAKILSKID